MTSCFDEAVKKTPQSEKVKYSSNEIKKGIFGKKLCIRSTEHSSTQKLLWGKVADEELVSLTTNVMQVGLVSLYKYLTIWLKPCNHFLTINQIRKCCLGELTVYFRWWLKVAVVVTICCPHWPLAQATSLPLLSQVPPYTLVVEVTSFKSGGDSVFMLFQTDLILRHISELELWCKKCTPFIIFWEHIPKCECTLSFHKRSYCCVLGWHKYNPMFSSKWRGCLWHGSTTNEQSCKRLVAGGVCIQQMEEVCLSQVALSLFSRASRMFVSSVNKLERRSHQLFLLAHAVCSLLPMVLFSCHTIVLVDRMQHISHGTRTCIKRKKIDYGKFFWFLCRKICLQLDSRRSKSAH